MALIETLSLHRRTTNQDDFEHKFRRYYADLYPDAVTVQKALAYYRTQQSSFEFPHIDEPSQPRIELIRWFMRKKDENDYHLGPPQTHSDYLFSDLTDIIGNTPVDVVYLAPGIASRTSTSSLYPETWETHLGKCINGLNNNHILPGNFSSVLWNGGMAQLEAVEDGTVSDHASEFTAHLAEPTYDRPIIVVSAIREYGSMVGSYHLFLGQKGVGLIHNHQQNRIPCFDFVGKDFSAARKHNYVLDCLSFF